MKVELDGTVIATFEDREDAQHFYEWKCNQILWARNEEILDEMAKKEGFDRRYLKAFPVELSRKYYQAAKAKIETECILVE